MKIRINYETMKDMYDELLHIFISKNHDYGNSFEQSLDKHGLIAGIVRMEDKMNRLSTLAYVDKDAKIASESLVDTLMDLSNYAAMSACWLMHKDHDFKSLSAIIHGSMNEEENHHKLSSFKGHDEKVNEREYYDRDDVTDEEIIKNWALEDTLNNVRTLRSRTTGQYFTEDDNPELFNKILGIILAYRGHKRSLEEDHMRSMSKIVREGRTGRDNINKPLFTDTKDILDEATFKKMKDQLTGTDEEFEGRFNDIKEMVISDINRSREVVNIDGIQNYSKKRNIPLLTEPKGLENGYFLRQHTNVGDSSRYTLAFSPEATVKVQNGKELPYVIECFGNDYDGMTGWRIHVFHSREDMVAALNYDLKVSNKKGSVSLLNSISDINVNMDTFEPDESLPINDAWTEFFGESFVKNMTCKSLFKDGYFGIKQGVKTFGPVFISKKTGALIVKGLLRERYSDRNHNIIWFSDTKEVLLEVNGTIPKFNRYGIIYGLDSTHIKNGDNIEFNPLYQTMEDKILSKFYSWDESELKNLVFFNEDKVVSSDFTDKNMQNPSDLVGEKSENTVGLDDLNTFSSLESGSLSSKNGKLGLDVTGGKLYLGGLDKVLGEK